MKAMLLESPGPGGPHPHSPRVQILPLEEANRALQLLKAGQIDGAGLLAVGK